MLEMEQAWSWQDPRITWPDECRQGGFLAEIRHLSKENFNSMWFPTYEWHDVQNVELVTGYQSHEEYIMWKVQKYILKRCLSHLLVWPYF